MRIGIDARAIAKDVRGIGRYTLEITKELTKRNKKICLYSTKSFSMQYLMKKNTLHRHINFKNKFAKLFFSLFIFSYWAKKDSLDLFWGAAHRLPFFLPKKIAKVVTVHDLVWKHASKTMNPINWILEKVLTPFAISNADIVIVDSKNTFKDLKEAFPCSIDKIRLIYPGVTKLSPPKKFSYLNKYKINSPYFLFVGTIEPRKNLTRLIKAYSSLPLEAKQKMKLVIAGGKGWGKIDLQSLIRELELDNFIILTGYIEEKELSTFYCHAKFLAMPSLYEGFGLPLVEAMSFGVPVLTSNISSLKEIPLNSGILVNPDDVKSISTNLKKLIMKDELRENLARNAKSDSENFSWETSTSLLLKAFEEAIKKKSLISNN